MVDNNLVNYVDPIGLLKWTASGTTEYAVLGSSVVTITGESASPVSSNILGATSINWTITAECDCGGELGSGHLKELTVDVRFVVNLKTSYSSNAEKRWIRETEQDHVADFRWWAKNVGKKVAQDFENTQKTVACFSSTDCINKAVQGAQAVLQASARAAVDKSIRDWDTSGKHTYYGK